MAPTSEGPGVQRVGQIAIPVRDVVRATAFYRDVLGLTFLFEAPPSLAFFDVSGVRLMLTTPSEGLEHASSVIYYVVADIEVAYDRLRERGAELVDAPHMVAQLGAVEVWMFFVRDPEGNTLGVMSERATS